MITIDFIKEQLATRNMTFFAHPERAAIVAPWDIAGRTIIVFFDCDVDDSYLIIRTGALGTISADSPAYLACLEKVCGMTMQHRFAKCICDPSDGQVMISGESWVMDMEPTEQWFFRCVTAVLHAAEAALEMLTEIQSSSESSQANEEQTEGDLNEPF